MLSIDNPNTMEIGMLADFCEVNQVSILIENRKSQGLTSDFGRRGLLEPLFFDKAEKTLSACFQALPNHL